jgi:hypothetical protein
MFLYRWKIKQVLFGKLGLIATKNEWQFTNGEQIYSLDGMIIWRCQLQNITLQWNKTEQETAQVIVDRNIKLQGLCKI